MPKLLIYFWVLLLMLTLLSCGGGGSGSGGANIVVTFGVEEDDTEVGPGSHRKLVADAAYADDGDPASGVGVSFSFRQNESGASLSRVTSETRGDGTAEGVYHAGQRPGNDIVEIKVGGAKATVNLRVAGGGEIVETLTLSADPDEVDIGGYSTIAVEGQTFEGLPAAGTRVEFSFEVNNSGGEFRHEGQSKQTITDYLDSSGRMSFTYRAGSSSGIDVINVKSLDLLQAREQISIIVGQAKALGEITLEGFKTATEAEWVVRAIVRDRDGNLAPNVTVHFNVDNGNIREPDESWGETTSVEVETNVNGIAEVILGDAYWATVYARIENVEQEIDVSIYEYFEAGSVTIEAPGQVRDDSVQINAIVKDEDDIPLTDIPVKFHADDNGHVDPANVPTDMYGHAQTTLTADQPGTVRVWANVGNVSQSKVINFTFEVEHEDIEITETTPPEGTVNSSYGHQLQVDGGTSPYTWSIDSGELPSGLSLNSSTGLISGIPTESGWFSFIVRVEDADGLQGTAAMSMEIKPEDVGELTITTTEPPEGIQNSSYGYQLDATGGRAPYTWSIISGELPSGLNLNSITGLISGVPTEPGWFSFIVRVEDADGLLGTAAMSMEIKWDESSLVITSDNDLEPATVNTFYTEVLEAEGGTKPYIWGIKPSPDASPGFGVLPDGLELDHNQSIISGLPTNTGQFNFVLEVTDSHGAKHYQSMRIVVSSMDANIITTSPLPDAYIEEPYEIVLSATGFILAEWDDLESIDGNPFGAIPDGLTLEEDGLIRGVPVGPAGVYTFTIKAVDTLGSPIYAYKKFELEVFE